MYLKLLKRTWFSRPLNVIICAAEVGSGGGHTTSAGSGIQPAGGGSLLIHNQYDYEI